MAPAANPANPSVIFGTYEVDKNKHLQVFFDFHKCVW